MKFWWLAPVVFLFFVVRVFHVKISCPHWFNLFCSSFIFLPFLTGAARQAPLWCPGTRRSGRLFHGATCGDVMFSRWPKTRAIVVFCVILWTSAINFRSSSSVSTPSLASTFDRTCRLSSARFSRRRSIIEVGAQRVSFGMSGGFSRWCWPYQRPGCRGCPSCWDFCPTKKGMGDHVLFLRLRKSRWSDVSVYNSADLTEKSIEQELGRVIQCGRTRGISWPLRTLRKLCCIGL